MSDPYVDGLSVFMEAVRNNPRKVTEGAITYIARIAARAQCRILPPAAKQIPREPGQEG